MICGAYSWIQRNRHRLPSMTGKKQEPHDSRLGSVGGSQDGVIFSLMRTLAISVETDVIICAAYSQVLQSLHRLSSSSANQKKQGPQDSRLGSVDVSQDREEHQRLAVAQCW